MYNYNIMHSSPLFQIHRAFYNFFARWYHKKYHGQYRSAKKLFIFDLFLLLLLIFLSLAGLFLYFSKSDYDDLIGLKIYLENPNIKSGEPAVVIVDYANHSELNLKNASVTLTLPSGFVVNREKTPESILSKEAIFNLKNIPAKTSGRFKIYGQLWAEMYVPQMFIALLSYRPENSARTDQKLQNFLWRASDSILKTNFTLPITSSPGKNVPFVITLFNTSSTTLEHIFLQINWPMPIRGDFLNLTLYPKEKKTYSSNYKAPNAPGKYTLQTAARVLVNGMFLDQSEAERTIKIINSPTNSR